MAGVIPAILRRKIVEKEVKISLGRPLKITLDRPGYVESLIVRAHIEGSSGTTAPTYKEDDIYRLFRRFTVNVEGTALKELSGIDLKYITLYNYNKYPQTIGALPTTADTSFTLDIVFKVPVALADSDNPEDILLTLFPSHDIRVWDLTIDFGTVADVVASGDLTIDESASYVTVSMEYYDKDEIELPLDELMVVRTITKEQDVVSTGEKDLDLFDGVVYRRIYLRAVNNDQRSDDLISEYKFKVSDVIVKESDWKTSRLQDIQEYGLESGAVGVTMIDFGTFDLAQSIEIDKDVPVRLRYTVATSPTQPAKIVAVPEMLIDYKVFKSR